MAEIGVFVSYRRADTQYVAAQLRDQLADAFGARACRRRLHRPRRLVPAPAR